MVVSQKEFDLSIIIVSFNVKKLLINCLGSIYKNKKVSDNWQIIVLDNGSDDYSLEEVQKEFPEVEVKETGGNLGFGRGNNEGVKLALSDFILFLNPDTEIVKDAIQKSLETIKTNENYGALTCRVELPGGELDYSCHRGFPTPWNSFCYFLKLSKLFPNSKLFSGYTASYLETNIAHEVECVSGSFLLVRREAGEQIGWWDPDYFWNGEDIEFCYRLKQKNWKILFYPKVKIIHYKGSSSGLWSSAASKVPERIKISSAKNAAESMRIFYKKHFYYAYPPIFRDIILWSINLLEKYRIFKITRGLKYE